MSVIYGAFPFRIKNPGALITKADALGTNSATYTNADPVTIAAGVVTVAGNSDVIYGVKCGTEVMTSTNFQAGGVKPLIFETNEEDLWLMGSNTDLNAITAIGKYCNLTANTTATVQIDGSNVARTTTDRVVEIVAVDPFAIGGTGAGSGLRQAVVKFVKTPSIGVPTSA